MKPSISRSIRVLQVTPHYFPSMGGVENHVYQVARRLAQTGVDVTVLTTDLEGKLPSYEQSEGIEIRRVRAWPAKKDYCFAPAIYRVVTQGGWDIVHVQSYHTLVAPLAMFAAWRAKIPYVVTFHGGGHSSRLRNAFRRVQRALLRHLLARAKWLIATAQFEVPLFAKALGLPSTRFVLIPNGGDLPLLIDPPSPPTESNRLVSIGRLERYKGHQRVIAALPYVLNERPDVRLWIAGSGLYEAELRRLTRRLGVEEHVEIRGIPLADRGQMANELSRAALVMLLSEYETHPMAILEALALGRPVLVADTSGLSELAERGLARTIPLNSSPAQVAEAILTQLRQPLIPASFNLPTWDDCAEELLSLYASISRGTPCAS